MMKNLEKNFDPKKVEKDLYHNWKKEGYFKPKNSKEQFSIILPPPNVTGHLHMGHALNVTIQDILIRFARMKGKETLWVPGTDHAGIATQNIVEKDLLRREGKKRNDFSREEFLQHIFDWKDNHQDVILSQLESLGLSLDWDRLRFTLDKTSSKGVAHAFKKMYDEGYIYRGKRLVNWDPMLQTALADEEVEYEDRDSSLWYIRYPIEKSSESIQIATTRPETMLGDVAVAVSPEDKRFKDLIGKNVTLPITNRSIPIIADDHVQPEFGTGCVKITPAHDFNDYEIAKRHKLEPINILNPNGTLNRIYDPYEGLSIIEARERIVRHLQELDLIVKIEPHKNRIGVSYRTNAVIEPYLSNQWFINMQPFKESLLSAVVNDKIKLYPSSCKKTYCHWIENLENWCISRQLWWGHRIPIWYSKNDPEKMICHTEEDTLPEEIKMNPDEWYQDEDVLDTWFSSALWPLTTLSWPDQNTDLKKFHPTSTLVTGHDILFFWVARMIMMSEYLTEKPPFNEVFIHGLLFSKSYWRKGKDGSVHYVTKEERISYEKGATPPNDIESKWEKMSKSKGNVIDPQDIIKEYGTDSLRMALTASITNSPQIDLDYRKFDEFRKFNNKIWNASKFVMLHISNKPALTKEMIKEDIDTKLLTLDDQWILSRYHQTINEVHQFLSEYTFDKYIKGIMSYFWEEFCAYYLETSKTYLFAKDSNELRCNKQRILLEILVGCLKLLHPVAPFITEEIFLSLNEILPTSAGSIIIETFPTADLSMIREEPSKQFNMIQQCIYQIRNLRADMQIPPGMKTEISFYSKERSNTLDLLKNHKNILSALLDITTASFTSSEEEIKKINGSSTFYNEIQIAIATPTELKDQEIKRLKKELENCVSQIELLNIKLENENFTKKAPENLVINSKKKRDDLENQRVQIEKNLKKYD